ncbi:hypothetical protein CDAR_318021 [Caerostris darwini]|uniref:Uncharacterized protein n=1 Tax=Caerostris darwini TaxID=1538125 RepID=A0AAV4WS46_9ARAC|nr:hypothetical protein CDAR_318021 [Caerostris darwini]
MNVHVCLAQIFYYPLYDGAVQKPITDTMTHVPPNNPPPYNRKTHPTRKGHGTIIPFEEGRANPPSLPNDNLLTLVCWSPETTLHSPHVASGRRLLLPTDEDEKNQLMPLPLTY